MITENGTIKAVTSMDEKMQKELSHSAYVLFLIFLIIGSVGLAAYLLLTVVWVFMELPDEGFFDFLLIVSAVLFAFGLIFVITINKNIKKVRELTRTNTYEFFNGYFIITETDHGEHIATAKVYNNQIIKGKETKSYLFFYINSSMAYPVSKENLSEGELNTLRRIFKLPVKGETVTIPAEELPDLSAEPVQNSVPIENIPQQQTEDPFADFDK